MVFQKFLDKEQVEFWFLAYVDLLHRLKLWNIATEIIQQATNLPVVQEVNEISTNVSLHCGSCGHSVPPTKYNCLKCNNVLSQCCICHQTVRGLYVWCQGCSHGGHSNHIKEWLKDNKECPAGCGHLCQYV